MGRPDFALLPRRGQAGQKAVKTALVTRRQVRGVARGQFRELVLRGTDLLQQP